MCVHVLTDTLIKVIHTQCMLLFQIADILKEAKFIEPSLGELPGALKARLSDANKNLVMYRVVATV